MTIAVDQRQIETALELGKLLEAMPATQLWLSERHSIWCLVDTAELPWINQWRWNWSWNPRSPWKHYAKRNTGAERTTIYLHREIMLRTPEGVDAAAAGMVVDHINGQSLDNRLCNLRWVTKDANRLNRLGPQLCPSLDTIVRRLLATHQPIEEAPF